VVADFGEHGRQGIRPEVGEQMLIRIRFGSKLTGVLVHLPPVNSTPETLDTQAVSSLRLQHVRSNGPLQIIVVEFSAKTAQASVARSIRLMDMLA
jgi:hypothetical protein